MEPERIPAQRRRSVASHGRTPTPESATWDVHEDAEIELLGEEGALDEVDVLDENWAPGQPAPGVPAEEVLHVHAWPDPGLSADDLDIDDAERDRLELASDELLEDETGP